MLGSLAKPYNGTGETVPLPTLTPEQRAAALDKAAAATPANAVVNLGGVSFMDSAALATLVLAMKRCRQAGGDLRLCNLQQPVRIIFELTRLDKAFDIYASETEALAQAALA